MKHLKYIFMAFAEALFAVSCSQDELPGEGATEEVPVTFTVTVDYAIETQGDDTAGDMKQAATRATSTEDDAPTRFYAQAVSGGTLSDVVTGTKIDDGTYSFTLQVAMTQSLIICFGRTMPPLTMNLPTFGAYHTRWATSLLRPKRRVHRKQSIKTLNYSTLWQK